MTAPAPPNDPPADPPNDPSNPGLAPSSGAYPLSMYLTLAAVLPIFGTIALGALAGQRGWLGRAAIAELNRFVVWLALPALLFEAMAEADWRTLWHPGFIAAFALGSVLVFIPTLLALKPPGRLADASLEGLNAGYANAGYIGVPLCDAVFGRSSLGLVTLAVLFTTSVLFGIAVVLVEIGLRQGGGPGARLRLLRSLVQNPILFAPILGALWSGFGLPMPQAAARFLHLLAGAASPCALVALGLFLAARRTDASPSGLRLPATLTALKLLVQPALAFALATLFGLPRSSVAVCVLLSALPTGTGSFMLAEKYGLGVLVTSQTILFSTLLSVLTLSALIYLLGNPA